jgi:hypothetical protein
MKGEEMSGAQEENEREKEKGGKDKRKRGKICEKNEWGKMKKMG